MFSCLSANITTQKLLIEPLVKFYTVCPEKNEPLNIFVFGSEKLP